ncbi:hypothetical protein D5086_015971 [Populus alba]|uniref:Uncharacterized protein n=1 Tax=Populus alba TaxID=43335 RepID=A0ACC4BSP3_POPAL
MWKPKKFKCIYLLATLYVFTLTLPSAAATYWAFGDQLLTHSNAFSLLPRHPMAYNIWIRLYTIVFVWEKVIGMHDTKSILLRALSRLPVVIPIWFFAIIFPFFGPINSAVGALLVSFTVYIIPALAHMLTYRSASARQIFDIGAAVRTEDLLSRDGHAIDALNLDEYRISELQHQSRLSNWSGSMAHSAKTAPNLGASFSSSTIRASAPTLPPPHHTLTHSMILSPDY